MALVGSVTGSVNLGGVSTFISSSNGSSVEIGAGTQVLVLSGGAASSLNPRNFPDTNFFVSGSINSAGSTTRGTSVFGGDAFVSGVLTFGGDLSLPTATGKFYQVGQNAYWHSFYPTNPAVTIAARNNGALLQLTTIASANYMFGKTRLGSITSAPTALLHLTASSGAASSAPLKFDSGSLMATPEAGAVEYDATNLYFTSGTTRQVFLTTLKNNAAVTSSFVVSTGSNMTLRVPGGGSETNRAIVMTRNGTPVPTFGNDAFLFVTGTAFIKDDASDRGVAVFAGDVVMSGNLWGGYQTFGGLNTTRLSLKGGQIILGGGGAPSFGAPTPENSSDVAVFISGSIGSKDGSSRGVTIIGGDTVISGSLFLEKAIDPTVVNPTTNSIGSFPNSTGYITSSLSLGNIFRVTLNNNTGSFLAPTNARDGQQATWIVKQSTFGSGIGVWATGAGGFAWPGGVAPTLSTSASAIDMVSAQYDGDANRWLATFAKGFV